MKKILIVFGTRPEAIKLAPVIKELKKEKKFKTIVCSTGQHREMVKHVLDVFNIKVDFELNIMKHNQDLFDISSNSLLKLKSVLDDIKPDLLLVQGDTTTAFTASLAAFYKKIKVGHVEAGLRSFNKFHPYPEEVNRRFISLLADFHFAPTKTSADYLLQEKVHKKNIFVTGNTVIDALLEAKALVERKSTLTKIRKSLSEIIPSDLFNKKTLLITLHRREKFGKEFENMLNALKELAAKYDYNFIYPVHLNPNVQSPVKKILNGVDNFYLMPPLNYLSFIYLMNSCYFILTDSGGIQEESYVFKKPIIVMRDVTERDEAVKAGYAFLTGSDHKKIIKTFDIIDRKLKAGFNFFTKSNPFGNGTSSKKIVQILRKNLL